MRTVSPRFSAPQGMARVSRLSSMTISASTFMPGRSPSVSSMRTVTGYAVMPPLVTPATDTLVTTPVYVLPSTASAVTSTVCPTATSEMSSSSIFMVISR